MVWSAPVEASVRPSGENTRLHTPRSRPALLSWAVQVGDGGQRLAVRKIDHGPGLPLVPLQAADLLAGGPVQQVNALPVSRSQVLPVRRQRGTIAPCLISQVESPYFLALGVPDPDLAIIRHREQLLAARQVRGQADCMPMTPGHAALLPRSEVPDADRRTFASSGKGLGIPGEDNAVEA